MKDYISCLLQGGTYIEYQTKSPGIRWIFNGAEVDELVPFEGNCLEIQEESPEFLDESYWESPESNQYYIKVNDIPNSTDGLVTLVTPNDKLFCYLEDYKSIKMFDLFEHLSDKIDNEITQMKANGITLNSSFACRCAVKPEIYRLTDAWMIFSSDIVYGKHEYSIGIIAVSSKRAREVCERLNQRMRMQPTTFDWRLDRFRANKYYDKYNGSEECNQLRYKYLKLIKDAYETFDFSKVFEYLDDKCQWGGATGKQAVIDHLLESAASMKQRNYWHRCTIVQVEKGVAPISCNTATDGTGERIQVALLHHGQIRTLHRMFHW